MFYLLAVVRAFVPGDPLYPRQFHLKNDGTVSAGLSGEDLNVEGAWNRSITGKGVQAVIVHDGCLPTHKEFGGRVNLNISWNFATGKNDPTPSSTAMSQDRGNQFAGLLGAEANDLCGVGVAPDVEIGCINTWEGMGINDTYFMQGLLMYPDVDLKIIPSLSSCVAASSTLVVCGGNPFSADVEAMLLQAKTTLVMSTNGIRTINADIVSHPIVSSPEVFSFTELSQRGAAVVTSVSGNVILASVVTGGTSYSSQYGTAAVHLVSSSGASEQACSSTVMVSQAGASIAAGAIALIMEAGKHKLRRSDIASIIALTSVKNDPNSLTWKKNAAGVWYSRTFGFGRVDADAATELAAKWKLVNEVVEEQTKKEVKQLPTLLGEAIEYEIDFSKTKIAQVVYINVFVKDYGVEDWGLVRLSVVSPMGTRRVIKDVMSLSYASAYGGVTWRVAARDFFGEDPAGVWKVILRREGIGPENYGVDTVTIRITGYAENAFTVPEKKSGSDPYRPYQKEKNASLVLSTDTVRCVNDALAVTLESNVSGDWELLMYQDEEGSRVETIASLKNGIRSNVYLPCVWKTNKFKIRAENSGSGTAVLADKELTVVNDYGYKLLSPEPYTVYKRENGLVSISFSMSRNTTHMSEYNMWDTVYVTIMDVERGVKLYVGTHAVTAGFAYTLPLNCNKCIMSVSPFYVEEPTMCDTLLTPISIIDEGDPEPEKWELPWNFICPVPDGVLVPSTPTPTSSPNSKKTTIIAASVATVAIVLIIGIIVAVYLWRKQRQAKDAYDPMNKGLIA